MNEICEQECLQFAALPTNIVIICHVLYGKGRNSEEKVNVMLKTTKHLEINLLTQIWQISTDKWTINMCILN